MPNVNATALAKVGYQYINTPYSEMDCQAFVERCLADCGMRVNLSGSNAWFRKMTWTGSPEECRKTFGYIPAGAFLFILEQDGKEPVKYRGDGIGNASHIGIYTAMRQGAIHSSASKGKVCESRFAGKSINGGWNRVGLWGQIAYDTGVNAKIAGDGGKEVKMDEFTEASYQARVINGRLSLRADASSSADRLGWIPDGATVTVIGETSTWARVTYKGQLGYAMRQFLAPVTESDNGSAGSMTIDAELVEGIGHALKQIEAAVNKIYSVIGRG